MKPEFLKLKSDLSGELGIEFQEGLAHGGHSDKIKTHKKSAYVHLYLRYRSKIFTLVDFDEGIYFHSELNDDQFMIILMKYQWYE